MARYEGMEDLLQRVRDRMGVLEPEGETDAHHGASQSPQDNAQYSHTLESLLILSRDSERLADIVTSGRLKSMTQEQQDDLLSILGKVLRDLWKAKAALERIKHED